MDKELEKAAKEYCGEGPEWQPDRGLFVAGANWQKERDIALIVQWLNHVFKENTFEGFDTFLEQTKKYLMEIH